MAVDAKVKITAADIRAAMTKTWGGAGGEYAILWEVAPATGYGHRPRYADAMLMSLWPSRGLELHGVEIKVSRSDWLREAKDPTKAEALAAFCDRWWLHVAPGVIHDLAEVPVTWGVRVWDGKKWATLREAEKTPAAPCDRTFLAALMRRAAQSVEARATIMADAVLERERAKIEEEIARGVAERSERKGKALEVVEAMEAALGFKLSPDGWGGAFSGYDPAQVGALVKVILDTGVLNGWRSLASVMQQMDHAVEQIAAGREDTMAKLKAAAGPYIEALDSVKERKKSKRSIR